MRKLIVFFFLILAFTFVKGQVFYSDTCMFAPDGQKATGCSATSPAFIDRHNIISNYIPVTNEPVKTIRINFNIMQKNDSSGNFQNNQDALYGIPRLDTIFNIFVRAYTQMQTPSDPITGVTSLSDSRFRFELNIYFYQNTSYWNSTNISAMNIYVDSIDHDRMNALNVYFTEISGYSYGYFPSDWNFSYNNGAIICGRYFGSGGAEPILNPPDGDLCTGGALAHEIGHCLQLHHPYLGGGSPTTVSGMLSSEAWFDDLFGIPYPGNAPHATNMCPYLECPPSVQWYFNPWDNDTAIYPFPEKVTNNIMGNQGNFRRYLSPQQIGKIQRAVHITSVRKYVKDDCYDINNPIIVSSNETWDFNIRLYQDLKIQSNATCSLTCHLEMPYQAKIIVESGSTLVVDGATICGVNNAMWTGTIEVKPGGNLIVNDGSQISMGGTGKILIDKDASGNGTLTYNQGALITLADAATCLEVKGNLALGANAIFSFTGSGYVKFSSTDATPANLTAGTNAKIELIGSDQSDIVLEIAQERLALPIELYHLKIENAQVKMTHSSTRIFQNFVSGQPAARCSLTNVKFTNNLTVRSSYCGLSLYEVTGTYITGCTFEKGACGIFTNLLQSISTISISDCIFDNCYTGMQVYGFGFDITECTFQNCYNGFYGSATTAASSLTDCYFSGNTYKSIYYSGGSGADLTLEGCTVNNSREIYATGSFTTNVRCCSVYASSIIGLQIAYGNSLNMSETRPVSSGHNYLYNNKYPVNFLSAGVPHLYQGYNNLIKKNVSGAFDLYGNLNVLWQTYNASYNEWKTPNGAPVSGVDYSVTKTGSNPIQYFTFSDLYPSTYTSCGGQQSSMGGELLSQTSQTGVLDILGGSVSTSLSPSLTDAENDMKSGNPIQALNKLLDLMETKIKKPSVHDETVFDIAFSDLNTALYKVIENKQLSHVQGMGVLSRVLAINDNEIEKSSQNYHRLLHRTLDKAHTYRLFGRQDLALNIIENILTWINPEEFDYIKGWYCVNKAETDYKAGLITLEEVDSLAQNCPCTIGSNMRYINNSGNAENLENVEMNIVSHKESVIEIAPNPVTSTSIITTTVDEKAGKAELHILNAQGITVKTYNANAGVSKIEISNNDFSSGVYWLQLYVNGVPEKTKKIITIK